MRLLSLIAVLGCMQPAVSLGWPSFGVSDGQWSKTLERDVCIVGGGASGTHAAVSLIDLNKTVVLIERNDYLGGHTHTYVDPETQAVVDIGVVIFQPVPVVYDFFEKFDVSLLNMSSVEVNEAGQPPKKDVPALLYNTVPYYLDFRDGSEVTLDLPTDEAVSDAFQRFTEVLSTYSYLLDGYVLPDPVPEDLYTPFGVFLEKYNLTAVIPILWKFTQGMGSLLNISTIYVIKYYNLDDLIYGTQGYLTEAKGNNSRIYTKAREYIGSDNLLLESTVIATNRQNPSSGQPEILVATPKGNALLSCKQILLATSPDLPNLRGWDLTKEEFAVFSQYSKANGYWTGLVRNVGLNQTVSYYNRATHSPSNIPALPGLYFLGPVGVIGDVWYIKFGAENPGMTDAQVQLYVESEIRTIQQVNNASLTKPEWLIFESHSPFFLQVSPEAIQNHFFANLTALQGGLGGTMFYTGGAFHTQYSTLLWRFNRDVVIPKMLRSG